ncbi:hypothetical protein GW17_00026153 [Ensete ventricosum]|nr:hypothetical protein GW17_00026153 [Ensete ventricosum]
MPCAYCLVPGTIQYRVELGTLSEIGSISSEIKSLQEKSMDMGLKLKNRKVCSYGVVLQGAESKLAKFVEDIIVPPRMVDIVIDGEVIKCFA